jgi:hypothetical protein
VTSAASPIFSAAGLSVAILSISACHLRCSQQCAAASFIVPCGQDPGK